MSCGVGVEPAANDEADGGAGFGVTGERASGRAGDDRRSESEPAEKRRMNRQMVNRLHRKRAPDRDGRSSWRGCLAAC